MTPPTGLGPCAPAGPRKFRVLRPRSTQILEKSRAARAKTTIMTGKNRYSALDNNKNEDPAKMTYSIPDFVCCDAPTCQHIVPQMP